MPNPDRRPRLWFSGEYDLREHASGGIFSRGVTSVALPAFDVDADEGLYENLHMLLFGMGSSAESVNLDERRDLTSEMEDQDPLGAGEVGIRVLSTDRLQIWRTGAFDLDASADNAKYGFSTAGGSAVLDISSGEYRLTASADWERGVVEDEKLTLTIAGPASYTIPANPTHAQNVLTLIRRRGRDVEDSAGAYDADDQVAGLSMEDLDNAACDTDDRRIRWYIDDDGHVTVAWPTSLALAKPVWATGAAGQAVKAAFGFSGNESTSTVGDVTIFRADYTPQGFESPSRPWARRPRRVGKSFGETERLVAGGAASAPVGHVEDLEVSYWLDGPESPDADDDLTADHNRRFLAHIAPGEPLTMYVGWDLRRHIEVDEVSDTVPAYGTLYAADCCGGRFRMLRSVDDAGEVAIDFDEEMGGDFWAEATLRLMPRASEG